MKTGRELLLGLPNGVRRNFILQLSKEKGYKKGKAFLDKRREDFGEMLLSTFDWSYSIKGNDYWVKIYRKL